MRQPEKVTYKVPRTPSLFVHVMSELDRMLCGPPCPEVRGRLDALVRALQLSRPQRYGLRRWPLSIEDLVDATLWEKPRDATPLFSLWPQERD